MRLLALTRYERLGASSRVRMLQYLPWLEDAGIEVITKPLFSNTYVGELQKGRRDWRAIMGGYAQRVACLLNTRSFDLIWVEKEALPWLPAWVETLLLAGSVPYVIDFDDAVFHRYDQHKNSVVRAMLGKKHKRLGRNAALVTVGNDYLASYARGWGAGRVETLPSTVDVQRYLPRNSSTSDFNSGRPVRIGWIGQRSTTIFLTPYLTILSNLVRDRNVQFVTIGAGAYSPGFPIELIDWTEETEVAALNTLDVGIMPLVDEPFERGKCGYKLIQYMACGIPVVASPVSANNEIVRHGENGFLAGTPGEWDEALNRLLSSHELRRTMGLRGREMVESNYSVQAVAPRLISLLRGAQGMRR